MNSFIGPVCSRTLTFWRLQNNPNKSQRIALRIKKSPRTAGGGTTRVAPKHEGVRSLAVNVRCINYIANRPGEVKIASAQLLNVERKPAQIEEIANHSRENP